jgi:HAD superfamily hydrolase (TIGR01509 family)
LSGQSLDREEVWISRRTAYLDTVAEQPILPGVKDYLEGAKERGLKLAVASSSPDNWVSGHLTRLCLIDYFDTIKTADDVARTKPDPELYNAALEALSIQADEAIVFEDSPNGVKAAKAAGIFCVAVPNPLTEQLVFEGADLRVGSLAEIRLEDLLENINGGI